MRVLRVHPSDPHEKLPVSSRRARNFLPPLQNEFDGCVKGAHMECETIAVVDGSEGRGDGAAAEVLV
jgi:hypothetical protein